MSLTKHSWLARSSMASFPLTFGSDKIRTLNRSRGYVFL
jgi:hypothetical protein